jgi:hypothetical protein
MTTVSLIAQSESESEGDERSVVRLERIVNHNCHKALFFTLQGVFLRPWNVRPHAANIIKITTNTATAAPAMTTSKSTSANASDPTSSHAIVDVSDPQKMKRHTSLSYSRNSNSKESGDTHWRDIVDNDLVSKVL